MSTPIYKLWLIKPNQAFMDASPEKRDELFDTFDLAGHATNARGPSHWSAFRLQDKPVPGVWCWLHVLRYSSQAAADADLAALDATEFSDFFAVDIVDATALSNADEFPDMIQKILELSDATLSAGPRGLSGISKDFAPTDADSIDTDQPQGSPGIAESPATPGIGSLGTPAAGGIYGVDKD